LPRFIRRQLVDKICQIILLGIVLYNQLKISTWLVGLRWVSHMLPPFFQQMYILLWIHHY